MPARRPTLAGASQREQLAAYLHVLTAHASPGASVEVRWRAGSGMRRRFIAAGRPAAAARLIGMLAPGRDVYVGVALRDGRRGGLAGIRECTVVHVEMDREDSLAALAGFGPAPTLVVGSGTDGHLHAYWSLREPVDPKLAEAANRALAAHLGGDPASCDAARILRPPGTLNHKHDPPREVALLAADGSARHAFAQLTAGLGLQVRPRRRARRRSPLPHGLGMVPARAYVLALAGLEADATGKVACPFHLDGTPSMQLYADNHFYCFGCRTGGSVVDFAARLWGITPRGAGFLEIVTRLRDRFGRWAQPAGPAILASPCGEGSAHARERSARRGLPRGGAKRGAVLGIVGERYRVVQSASAPDELLLGKRARPGLPRSE